MSYALYLVGYLVMIGGLCYGAMLLHVVTHWIIVGAVVLSGLAILSGFKATRQKDPAN
jgi:hypothetical protein